MKCIKFVNESSGGVFVPGEVVRMSNEAADHYVNHERDAVYTNKTEWKNNGRVRVNI